MARYYSIVLTPPTNPITSITTGAPVSSNVAGSISNQTGSGAPVAFGAAPASTIQVQQAKGILDLFPLTSTGNPNAYDIEVDLIFSSDGAANTGTKYLKIYGIDPAFISQVHNLDQYNIGITLGFDKGLPLSTLMASKSRNINLVGTIWQPYGNWIGTELYLVLPIIPLQGSVTVDANITSAASVGQNAQTAITNSLSAAFPNLKFTVDVNPNLVLQQEGGWHGTFGSLSDFIAAWGSTSKSILGAQYPSYSGISASWKGDQLVVTDKSNPTGSKNVTIQVTEVVGNPVWIEAGKLQLVCPMRSDITIFDTVTLPNTPIAIGGPQVAPRWDAPFSGTYIVQETRFVGRYRSNDSMAWIAVYTLGALPVTPTNANTPAGSSAVTPQ